MEAPHERSILGFVSSEEFRQSWRKLHVKTNLPCYCRHRFQFLSCRCGALLLRSQYHHGNLSKLASDMCARLASGLRDLNAYRLERHLLVLGWQIGDFAHLQTGISSISSAQDPISVNISAPSCLVAAAKCWNSPYSHQSRRPRGTSSAVLSSWELRDVHVSKHTDCLESAVIFVSQRMLRMI